MEPQKRKLKAISASPMKREPVSRFGATGYYPSVKGNFGMGTDAELGGLQTHGQENPLSKSPMPTFMKTQTDFKQGRVSSQNRSLIRAGSRRAGSRDLDWVKTEALISPDKAKSREFLPEISPSAKVVPQSPLKAPGDLMKFGGLSPLISKARQESVEDYGSPQPTSKPNRNSKSPIPVFKHQAQGNIGLGPQQTKIKPLPLHQTRPLAAAGKDISQAAAPKDQGGQPNFQTNRFGNRIHEKKKLPPRVPCKTFIEQDSIDLKQQSIPTSSDRKARPSPVPVPVVYETELERVQRAQFQARDHYQVEQHVTSPTKEPSRQRSSSKPSSLTRARKLISKYDPTLPVTASKKLTSRQGMSPAKAEPIATSVSSPRAAKEPFRIDPKATQPSRKTIDSATFEAYKRPQALVVQPGKEPASKQAVPPKQADLPKLEDSKEERSSPPRSIATTKASKATIQSFMNFNSIVPPKRIMKVNKLPEEEKKQEVEVPKVESPCKQTERVPKARPSHQFTSASTVEETMLKVTSQDGLQNQPNQILASVSSSNQPNTPASSSKPSQAPTKMIKSFENMNIAAPTVKRAIKPEPMGVVEEREEKLSEKESVGGKQEAPGRECEPTKVPDPLSEQKEKEPTENPNKEEKDPAVPLDEKPKPQGDTTLIRLLDDFSMVQTPRLLPEVVEPFSEKFKKINPPVPEQPKVILPDLGPSLDLNYLQSEYHSLLQQHHQLATADITWDYNISMLMLFSNMLELILMMDNQSATSEVLSKYQEWQAHPPDHVQAWLNQHTLSKISEHESFMRNSAATIEGELPQLHISLQQLNQAIMEQSMKQANSTISGNRSQNRNTSGVLSTTIQTSSTAGIQPLELAQAYQTQPPGASQLNQFHLHEAAPILKDMPLGFPAEELNLPDDQLNQLEQLQMSFDANFEGDAQDLDQSILVPSEEDDDQIDSTKKTKKKPKLKANKSQKMPPVEEEKKAPPQGTQGTTKVVHNEFELQGASKDTIEVSFFEVNQFSESMVQQQKQALEGFEPISKEEEMKLQSIVNEHEAMAYQTAPIEQVGFKDEDVLPDLAMVASVYQTAEEKGKEREARGGGGQSADQA